MLQIKTLKHNGFLNVGILTLAQMLAFTAIPMLMFIGTFVGADLAPDPKYATLPIAAHIVGTALGTVPMALLMQKLGRKPVFIMATIAAAVCCFALGQAIALRSFFLFCFFVAVLGACMAAIQQFRFAAMESVSADKASAAASLILVGGIFAAFTGPELAVLGQHLSSVEYQGSFYLVISTYLLSMLLLLFYRQATITSNDKEVGATRSLPTILKNKFIWLPIASAATGFAIMSFVMTATPISMHHMHGHSLAETKWVIQSHIAFMFLPSLITPFIVKTIGLRGMVIAGLIAYLLCIGIAVGSTSVTAFWLALVCLGIGWNFLFVAGTSLLPENYEPSEQYKVQAMNDAVVFSTQAIVALSAGFILNLIGWQSLLLVCLPLMGMLVFVLWYTRANEPLQTSHG